MCLFTCSWFWVIPLPVSDPSLLPLIVASVVQWFTKLDNGVVVTLVCPGFPFWDVCVLRSSGKLSHTTRRNAIIWGRQFSHIQEPDWLHFFFKSYVFSSVNAHRGHWSCRRLRAAQCEWWELSTCPLQHSEPSYTEPSPQPPNWVFILSILNAVFFFCLVNLIFFH